MTVIPLARAMLCCQCDSIVEYQPSCPACGSRVLQSVQRWIQRLEHALIERTQVEAPVSPP